MPSGLGAPAGDPETPVVAGPEAPCIFLGLEGEHAMFALDISAARDPVSEGPIAGLGHFRDARAAGATLPFKPGRINDRFPPSRPVHSPASYVRFREVHSCAKMAEMGAKRPIWPFATTVSQLRPKGLAGLGGMVRDGRGTWVVPMEMV